MSKVTIKALQDQLATIRELHTGDARIIAVLREENTTMKKQVDDLTRDKQWLKQLCQQQSLAIASYMGSR